MRETWTSIAASPRPPPPAAPPPTPDPAPPKPPATTTRPSCITAAPKLRRAQHIDGAPTREAALKRLDASLAEHDFERFAETALREVGHAPALERQEEERRRQAEANPLAQLAAHGS